ncbi:hypothetical protein C8J57DRAFT_1244484 [Mycena rebaudengoi]|nr:hypothetical protein C8J57DRAFT_1244484 [Mycena rebaudengoi]
MTMTILYGLEKLNDDDGSTRRHRVLAKFVTSLDREDGNLRDESSSDNIVFMNFRRIELQLLTSTVAAVPRTLCQDIYTEAALRRWCSSNEALANSPSPIKTGIIRGVDAVRFTGLRGACLPLDHSFMASPEFCTLLVDTKAPKALDKKPVVFARTATPMPEGRGL